jgi:hypothetical protein
MNKFYEFKRNRRLSAKEYPGRAERKGQRRNEVRIQRKKKSYS